MNKREAVIEFHYAERVNVEALNLKTLVQWTILVDSIRHFGKQGNVKCQHRRGSSRGGSTNTQVETAQENNSDDSNEFTKIIDTNFNGEIYFVTFRRHIEA